MVNGSRVWESTVYSAAKNLVEKLAGIEKIFAPTYSAGAAGLRPAFWITAALVPTPEIFHGALAWGSLQ
jgi:hypothetical protein